jgi:hypothetical protein
MDTNRDHGIYLGPQTGVWITFAGRLAPGRGFASEPLSPASEARLAPWVYARQSHAGEAPSKATRSGKRLRDALSKLFRTSTRGARPAASKANAARSMAVYDEITLVGDDLLRIDRGRGVAIHVNDGDVWLTQDGDRRDYTLADGETFWIGRDGVTVVQARRVASLTVSVPVDRPGARVEVQPVARYRTVEGGFEAFVAEQGVGGFAALAFTAFDILRDASRRVRRSMHPAPRVEGGRSHG